MTGVVHDTQIARRSAYLFRREKYLRETGRPLDWDLEFTPCFVCRSFAWKCGHRETDLIPRWGIETPERHSRRGLNPRRSVSVITAGRTVE